MARGRKLMDDQKAAIRAAHDTGVPYTALAVQYGVSVATILRVCRQDTYERQKAANRRYQAANIRGNQEVPIVWESPPYPFSSHPARHGRGYRGRRRSYPE